MVAARARSHTMTRRPASRRPPGLEPGQQPFTLAAQIGPLEPCPVPGRRTFGATDAPPHLLVERERECDLADGRAGAGTVIVGRRGLVPRWVLAEAGREGQGWAAVPRFRFRACASRAPWQGSRYSPNEAVEVGSRTARATRPGTSAWDVRTVRRGPGRRYCPADPPATRRGTSAFPSTAPLPPYR